MDLIVAGLEVNHLRNKNPHLTWLFISAG